MDSQVGAISSTSLGLSSAIEAAISNICSISALIMFFLERENLYVRAHCIQSIFYFLICCIISLPFFIFCLCFGGAMEIIFIIMIVTYFIGRIVLIGLSIYFAREEVFLSVPLIKNVILKLAN